MSPAHRIDEPMDQSPPLLSTLSEWADPISQVRLSYETLVQTIPDIVYLIDPAGIFVFLNDAIENIGYMPHELVGKHFSVIIHPNDVATVSRESVLPSYYGKITGDGRAPKLFDERRSGPRRTRDLEIRVVGKGHVAQEQDCVYSLVYASGFYRYEGSKRRFLGTVGIMRDITSSKRFEEELRRREAFNYALFEYNPIETVVVDRQARVTKFNLAKRKAGDRLPAIGDIMYRDYANKHVIDMYNELMECMRTGTPREFYDLPYGDQFLSIHISPFEHGAIITSQNVTQRRQAEARLRESERRFRETADLLPTVICECDRNLKITYVNKTGLDLFGYTIDDLTCGITLQDILHPDEAPKVRQRTLELFAGKTLNPVEYRARCKDGSELLLLVNSAPIYRNDSIVGFRTSAINITYRRTLEQEVQKAQILESLGILAGGIGHDFNNILAGIYGNVQLAQKKLRTTGDITPYLTGIEKATERAVALSRQLLTFAKGGAPIRRLTTLQDLIRETATFALRGSKANCSFNAPADLWPCLVDPGQISQVINNLVLNASQAMPHGGTVTIEAKNISVEAPGEGVLQPGRFVRIRVSDTGVGIPQQYLQKIFEPYFTTKHRGTGLGLTVSYSIIAKHGGSISVESTPGKGTTFTVYVPAAEQPLVPPSRGPVAPARGKGRVLLMDDDEIVRTTGCEILRELGYEVQTATEGTEAVEKYRLAMAAGTPFTAVVLDLTIPGGMGGREALEQIRNIDPHVVALVSSGYSDDPVMANPAQYGFAAVLAKPYRIDEMAHTLAQVIDEKKS